MESFFCAEDCDACVAPDEDRTICMQARICDEYGIGIEKWIEECSCRFRELWNSGMRDKAELAATVRASHSKVVSIVPVALQATGAYVSAH